MSEYTPTTEQVRSGYVWLSAGDNPGAQEEASEDFYRWLRGVLADAWDEGADAGYDDAEAGREEKHNPYREEN